MSCTRERSLPRVRGSVPASGQAGIQYIYAKVRGIASIVGDRLNFKKRSYIAPRDTVLKRRGPPHARGRGSAAGGSGNWHIDYSGRPLPADAVSMRVILRRMYPAGPRPNRYMGSALAIWPIYPCALEVLED